MKFRITKRNITYHPGFTLVEMMMAMTLNAIIVLSVGVLMMGGNRGWQNIYSSAYGKAKQDSQATTLAFGSIGRKSNRLSYIIYNLNGNTLTPATPKTSNPQEVISGNAVEFRYWDVALDTTDSHNLMDNTKMATAYALFYLQDGKLKVDYGPYLPGAAPKGGGAKNTSNITTQTLAENVTAPTTGVGPFSHTTINGIGFGCVRINLTITDPGSGKAYQVMTSTLMRNIWPR
jgi:hypothetical protein